MYCPNCAKSASTDQKFCRSCGLNLERAAESLSEQLNGNPDLSLRRHEQALEKFGNVVFTGLGTVIVIGILGLIYGVLTKMVLSGAQPVVGLLLILFLLFAAPSLAYVFWRESLKDRRAKLIPSQNPELEQSTKTAELGDATSFTPIHSVVEPTTELLLAENTALKIARQSDSEHT